MSDFTFRGLAIGVCAIVGGVGCDPAPPPPASPTPSAAAPSAAAPSAPTASAAAPPTAPRAGGDATEQATHEADSLARLRALQVFTIKELVAGQPAERMSCYGPCETLGRFVQLSEAAAKQPAPAGSCEPAAIQANLAKIEALKVVRVEGLVKGGDAAATCARAGKLANIADVALHLAQKP
jgi:hypothetical protein